MGYVSCWGNFSQPMYRVSKASVPSVRCSNKSSSDSGCFSIDLFLRKPNLPRSTPADWMAKMRSSLFWHEALLTSEALIDEEVFLIVAHRVA